MRGLTAKAPSPAVHKGSLAPAGPGLVHRTANYANFDRADRHSLESQCSIFPSLPVAAIVRAVVHTISCSEMSPPLPFEAVAYTPYAALRVTFRNDLGFAVTIRMPSPIQRGPLVSFLPWRDAPKITGGEKNDP